jgi:hypothetical protein
VSSRRLQPRAGSTQEIGNRARPALTAHSKSSRRQADDRGLLRIRFEWNNPFK